MSADLVRFLSRYITVSERLADTTERLALVQRHPKGMLLLEEGQPVTKTFFVLKGCIREASWVFSPDGHA